MVDVLFVVSLLFLAYVFKNKNFDTPHCEAFMLARKSALIMITNVLNGLLGYVALFYIARYMSPDAYGIMAFAYSFVALFTIFAKLGFDQSHIKKVSEGKDLGKCIGTFIVTKTGLTFLMAILVIGSIFFWKFILGRGFESSTHETAVYLMIGYWVLHMLGMIFIGTFKAKKEIAKSELPLFFETLIRVAVTIYVALSGYGAIALVSAYIAGDVIFLLSALYFSRKYPLKKPTKAYIKDYSTFAFPLSIVVASLIIMKNTDRVLIQLFWSAADVGYYFAAFKLSAFINLFTMAIGSLLFPTYSALHSKKNIDGIRRLTYQSERYLSMIVFPMVFGMVILAEPTTRILLSEWIPAIPILQILPFFVLFTALERPYQSQLMGMNHPHLARNRVIIMVCLNVILNLILIPKDIQSLNLTLFGLGAQGAAIATVCSYVVGLFYSRLVALKLTGVKGNPRIILHLIAAILMSGFLYWLNKIFFIARWYHLIGFALIGFGFYLFILFIFKEFTKKDFHFFFDTLNIAKMLKYIKDEITGKGS